MIYEEKILTPITNQDEDKTDETYETDETDETDETGGGEEELE